ncbi:MAG: SDR family oxidoreductase [Phycisphaerales bacterium]|nr:SDR family oxidoreductase [Phycisphaerales bacterium]MCB9856916.1 SDR family oxidoreductase [Phycisphaerales bacterium]MCB9861957.1 SDR family oxidoreductase [Phycisphaerales bacterium]
MNFLVTGGAGFIGSHLVRGLLGRGHAVRVLDDFSSGKRENLHDTIANIDLIEGNAADPAVARRACADMEVVLHEAAIPSVPRSIDDPESSHIANTNGTFQLLLAARDAGVRRFVYAASSSAYGETPQLPKVESMPTSPLSPYAVQKLSGEHYCKVFYDCYGLSTLALRYFNVFGPYQNPKSQYAAAIPAFVTAILRGESPTVYGDGEQTRDFTYIDNVIEANCLAAEAAEARGEALNIACGASISVNRIIAMINEHLGANVKPNYVPNRPGDIRDSWADIRLAQERIGYTPIVDIAEGLSRTIEWYKSRSQAGSLK